MNPEMRREMPVDGEARRSAEIEARRTALLESLERRVEGVRELQKTIDSFAPDADPAEIEKGLETVLKHVFAKLPTEKMKMIGEAPGLAAIVERFREKERGAGSGSPADKASVPSERETAEFVDAFRRLREISSDPELVFFRNLAAVTKDLLAKNQIIRALGGVPGKAVDLVVAATERPIDADKVRNVRIGVFDVGLVIESGHYSAVIDRTDKVGDGSEGMHRKGTPVYVVREKSNAEDTECTARHERTHVLLDGAGVVQDQPIDKLIETALDPANAASGVKEAFFALPAKERVDLIFDSQHNELLADLEEEEGRVFGSFDPGDAHPYDVFGTAGSRWWRSIVALNSAEGRLELDEDTRAKCAETRQSIHENALRLARVMGADVSVAKRLGPDALDDVHALFAVLPPTKYHDIRLFLGHRYGKEKVRELWDSHETERAARLADSIRGIREKLERDPGSIPAGRLKMSVLGRTNSIMSAGTGIRDLPEFIRFVSDLDRINELSGTRAVDGAIGQAWRIFTVRKLRESLADGFRGVPEFYEGLPEKYKASFRMAVEQYVATAFFSDLKDKNIATPETYPDIRQTPHWQAIERIILSGGGSPEEKPDR